MSAMASGITDVSVVCSPICSREDQRKHQSSASLAFIRGIHRWPVDSLYKWPPMRSCFHLMTLSWFSETAKLVLRWFSIFSSPNLFYEMISDFAESVKQLLMKFQMRQIDVLPGTYHSIINPVTCWIISNVHQYVFFIVYFSRHWIGVYVVKMHAHPIPKSHYNEVIMGAMTSQIASLTDDCLLNRLFRRRSKKTPKLPVTGLCEGNSPVAQRDSNAENVSIWWRHHAQ